MRLVQFAVVSAAALMAAATLAAAGPLDGLRPSGSGGFQTLSSVHASPLASNEMDAVRGAETTIRNLIGGHQQTVQADVQDTLEGQFICGVGQCYLPGGTGAAIPGEVVLFQDAPE